MEMRRVVVTIGPEQELQSSGIVPVRRCSNEQCNAMSTVTDLNIGVVVNLVSGVAHEQAEKAMVEMKAKIAELESRDNALDAEFGIESVPAVDTSGSDSD
jgi:hypothetical protein